MKDIFYQFYTQGASEYRPLLEYEKILSVFSEDKDRAIELFKEFSKLERDDLVKEIISRRDISLRKIAELTGINREIVRKISVSREPSL